MKFLPPHICDIGDFTEEGTTLPPGTTRTTLSPATRVQEPGRFQNFEKRAGGQPNSAADLRPQWRSGVISFRAHFSKAVTNLHKF